MKEQVVDFTPGEAQSISAAKYYKTIADELIDSFLDDSTEIHCLVNYPGDIVVPMKFFIKPGTDLAFVSRLVRIINNHSVHLGECNSPKGVVSVLRAMQARSKDYGYVSFLVEAYPMDSVFPLEEKPVLALYVEGGVLQMLWRPTMLLVPVEDGGYGLAIASKGSYLIRLAA